MDLPFAETKIRRGIALQEAQASRESLYSYNAKCNPAADYMALCEEIGLLPGRNKNTKTERKIK
jgi:cellulose biosynthesis protein BcsQ